MVIMAQIEAGVDGSRTHQGLFCTTPRTVLKTARNTGHDPLPARFYRGASWASEAPSRSPEPGRPIR